MKIKDNLHFDHLNGDTLIDAVMASEFLGISTHALQVWRTTGRYGLPYCKIGRLVRYRLSDLKQFIEKRMVIHVSKAKIYRGDD